MGITQSISKTGYPYDNAPMEHYFNTLKNELMYLHDYLSEDDLYASVDEFAYIGYTMCGRTHITDTRFLLKLEQELAIIKLQVLQKSLTIIKFVL